MSVNVGVKIMSTLYLMMYLYRTEYVSECWSKDDEYTVLDDVPECETVTEQKCHEELVKITFPDIFRKNQKFLEYKDVFYNQVMT